MGLLSAVLLVIGILAAVDGLAASFFPRLLMKLGRIRIKSEKSIRKAGIMEIIVAIIIIVIAINV